MFRGILKTSGVLLVGLFLSICARAETSPWMPGSDTTQQSFLEEIVRTQFSAPFTPNAAAAFGIEAGSRNFRLEGNILISWATSRFHCHNLSKKAPLDR